MNAMTNLAAISWDSLLVFVLVVGAAWIMARRFMKWRRPVCDGGCPGCYGARRGRGCASSDRDLNVLIKRQ